MHEITLNLHMHTNYSDGTGSHSDIAKAAMNAGLDAVIVTDHNVLVPGKEKIYSQDNKKILLMVGEEVHDQDRLPQKNHLIVIGADRELAHLAHDLTRLIDGIQQAGGLAFIAHPDDPEALAVGETDITWEAWEAIGIAGIEIWNGFSEFKKTIKSRFHAIYYAFLPNKIAMGPSPETLRRWDALMAKGQKIVAIGGSDAHALKFNIGPFSRVVFPYEWHFRSINTHVLLNHPLSGDLSEDRKSILSALANGSAFIGYDLPASTHGFRFTANGSHGKVEMGQETTAKNGVTFQIKLPRKEECRLVYNGETIKTWQKQEICSYIASYPGVYRVEVYITYRGQKRGWIFSNPIYITP
jgi:predicted metal-dependent phosphoesterase TrpH